MPDEWILFVFTPRDGVSESPAAFIQRLNDPGRLPSLSVVVRYAGMTVKWTTMTLTASMLRSTNFLLDLKGDGGRDLLTRNQVHEVTSTNALQAVQILYKETPDEVPDEVLLDKGWLYGGLFKEVRISAEELWKSEVYLLRMGFSGEDLSPDKHREFRKRLTTEMNDTSDTHLTRASTHYAKTGQTSTSVRYKGGVPFIASIDTGVTRTSPSSEGGKAGRLSKAEFAESSKHRDSFLRVERRSRCAEGRRAVPARRSATHYRHTPLVDLGEDHPLDGNHGLHRLQPAAGPRRRRAC